MLRHVIPRLLSESAKAQSVSHVFSHTLLFKHEISIFTYFKRISSYLLILKSKTTYIPLPRSSNWFLNFCVVFCLFVFGALYWLAFVKIILCNRFPQHSANQNNCLLLLICLWVGWVSASLAVLHTASLQLTTCGSGLPASNTVSLTIACISHDNDQVAI